MTVALPKLGKLAHKVDPRTLQLAKYAIPTQLPIPLTTWQDWESVEPFPIYDNDTLGDCTIAAVGHAIQCWTRYGKHKEVTLPEPIIKETYFHLTGGQDTGLVELDVLNYWRKTGIGGHKIVAFAQVDHLDHTLVKQACEVFGGLYLGIQLPVAAQGQAHWYGHTNLNGDNAPGSWGGHAVDVCGFNTSHFRVVTWGQTLWGTWRFWDQYVDEAWVILTQDWLDTNGKSPMGFDVNALLADLKLV